MKCKGVLIMTLLLNCSKKKYEMLEKLKYKTIEFDFQV